MPLITCEPSVIITTSPQSDISATHQYDATVLNADDAIVNWSIEPETVATIDNTGLVTGVAAGKQLPLVLPLMVLITALLQALLLISHRTCWDFRRSFISDAILKPNKQVKLQQKIVLY